MAAVLNLSEDGSPLTTQAAISGEHKAEWALESDKEFRKLVTATETISPIHRHQIPEDWRKDKAYYRGIRNSRPILQHMQIFPCSDLNDVALFNMTSMSI
jgi:hypothetical protein